jgi:hypothetical protein
MLNNRQIEYLKINLNNLEQRVNTLNNMLLALADSMNVEIKYKHGYEVKKKVGKGNQND